MTQLFKKKDPADLRSFRVPIRLTKKEDEKIRHSARARNLSVAEFVRRAALARKTNTDHEDKIVAELKDVTAAIRLVHKNMVEHNIAPPEEIWPLIMDQAMATMARITK